MTTQPHQNDSQSGDMPRITVWSELRDPIDWDKYIAVLIAMALAEVEAEQEERERD
jgi:hypothetical protein